MNVLHVSCDKCVTLVITGLSQLAKLSSREGGEERGVMIDRSRTLHRASSLHWRHSIIISKSNYSLPSLFTPCYRKRSFSFDGMWTTALVEMVVVVVVVVVVAASTATPGATVARLSLANTHRLQY
jgi:hypothetical protein